MEKELFDEICSKLNIDENVKLNARKQYLDISRNTILDVSVLRIFISPLIANESCVQKINW